MDAFLFVFRSTLFLIPHTLISCFLLYYFTKKTRLAFLFKIGLLVTLAFLFFFYAEALSLLGKSNLPPDYSLYRFFDALNHLSSRATRVFDVLVTTYFFVNFSVLVVLFYKWLRQLHFFKTRKTAVKLTIFAVFCLLLLIELFLSFLVYFGFIYGIV
jgi:hypothetical protein